MPKVVGLELGIGDHVSKSAELVGPGTDLLRHLIGNCALVAAADLGSLYALRRQISVGEHVRVLVLVGLEKCGLRLRRDFECVEGVAGTEGFETDNFAAHLLIEPYVYATHAALGERCLFP